MIYSNFVTPIEHKQITKQICVYFKVLALSYDMWITHLLAIRLQAILTQKGILNLF